MGYPNATVTNSGLNMIAESQTGKKLIFTSARLGDGQLGSQSAENLTQLINEKMTVGLQSVTNQGNGQVVIRFVFTAAELTSDFDLREIGIYAKIGDSGTSQLYAYTNAGDNADHLSQEYVGDEVYVEINVAIGNATEITAVIDTSIVYATVEDLQDHIGDNNAAGTASETNYGHVKASAETPLMDGTADVGADDGTYARGLHRHPTDTTRAPLDSPALTGTPTAPTADAETNTTQIATTAWTRLAMTAIMAALGFVISPSKNGYIKFPSCLGGLVIQWGYTLDDYSPGTFLFPIAFPTNAFTIIAGNTDLQGQRVDNAFAYIIDNTSYYIGTKRSDEDGITGFPSSYIAIGN
ncbi:MAG: gp53-like domain-containing protein [Sporomusa sp.]